MAEDFLYFEQIDTRFDQVSGIAMSLIVARKITAVLFPKLFIMRFS